MINFTNKIKVLKKSRDKQIRRLSKLLNVLVAAEWDMVTNSYEQNDKVGLLASKSVADASKHVQTAISQLNVTSIYSDDPSQQETKLHNIKKQLKLYEGNVEFYKDRFIITNKNKKIKDNLIKIYQRNYINFVNDDFYYNL